MIAKLIFWIFFILILMTGFPVSSSEIKAVDPFSQDKYTKISRKIFLQSDVELEKIFEMILNHITKSTPVRKADAKYIRLFCDHIPITWQGKSLKSILQLKTPGRETFQLYYHKDIQSMFHKYFQDKGWNIRSIGSDHYGESEYRELYEATKENFKFYYFFSARNLRNGDWDGNIFILDKSTSMGVRQNSHFVK